MASGIERSIRRLDGALDALETAVSRRLSAEPFAGRGPDEPSAGADDGSRRTEGSAADLERARREASRRLERAIAALRGVLSAGTEVP